MRKFLSLGLGLLTLISSARAITVLSVTGTPINCLSLGGNNGVAANGVLGRTTWTQTKGYSNVTISAALQTFRTYTSITAYLTNQQGPGTTVANQIAVNTVNAPLVGAVTSTLTTLFTGLTLDPGTYFLTVVGDPASDPGHPECWSFTNAPTTTTDTGVSGIFDGFANGALGAPGPIAAYPPATSVINSGNTLLKQITGDPFTAQISYAANLGAGQSVVDLTNAGTNGGNDKNDYICANVYVFAQDQQLISCCTCELSPNDLQTLSVQNDLINNTLTPGVPTGVTIALVALDDTGKGHCNAATVVTTKLVSGLDAWGTKLHAAPGGGFAVTETPFSKVGLSPSELNKMVGYCSFIQADGSKYGICNSCQPGAQGAKKQ